MSNAHLRYFERPISPDDEPIIWQFLAIAAHEDSIEVVRDTPKLAVYAADWGRDGDGGFMAQDGEIMGVIWWRMWRGEERGFGFVDADTPELALAVRPEFQNRGIGSSLMRRAVDECGRMSLNVRAQSRAVELYRRFGFEIVAGSERTNRVGGVSFNMLRPS